MKLERDLEIEEAIKRVEQAIRMDKENRIPTKYDEKPLFRDTLQVLLDYINELRAYNFNTKRENETLLEFKLDHDYIRRIKSFLKWNILIAEYDDEKITYRPIKNTTKQDIYEAYYEIQELLEMRKFDNLIK